MLMSVISRACEYVSMPELAGARVLITGLTSATGFDVARSFADHGARLIVQSPEDSPEMTELARVLAENCADIRMFNDPLANDEDVLGLVKSAVQDFGGYAVGAHAGRPRIGVWEYIEAGRDLSFIPAIEELNGGSSAEENGRSMALVEKHGFKRIGGSDAHYVSSIGRCLTAFHGRITRMEQLVEHLREGDYRPVRIEETLEGFDED